MGREPFSSLPIGDQGLQFPQRAGSGETRQDVAIQSGEATQFQTVEHTANIASGNTVNDNLRAASGSVWELVKLDVNIPGISGSTGDHSLIIRTELEGIEMASIENASGTTGIQVEDGVPLPDGNSNPSGHDFIQAVRGLRFDDTNGLQFRYINNTDSTQTGTLTYKVAVREVIIA